MSDQDPRRANNPADVNQLVAALAEGDVLRQQRDEARAEVRFLRGTGGRRWRDVALAIVAVISAVSLLLLGLGVRAVNSRADAAAERSDRQAATLDLLACQSAAAQATFAAANAFLLPNITDEQRAEATAALERALAEPVTVTIGTGRLERTVTCPQPDPIADE